MARRSGLTNMLLARVGQLFILFLGALPLSVARRMTRALAPLVWRLVPRLGKIGRQNLDLAYGDSLSPAEKDRILREALDNLCILAAEVPHMRRASRNKYQGLIRYHGLENLDKEAGAIVAGAHIANWEWVAPSFAAQGNKIAGIARALNHPALDTLINDLRSMSGLTILYKEQAAREAIRYLREGSCVGLLVDQAPRDNAVPVTFFGQPCWATAAPVVLAMRARKPIHMIQIVRAEDGCYDVSVEPALELVRSGNTLQDLESNCQRVQDVIEKWVRARPGQWLWFHKRWKERPELAREWEARRAKRMDRATTAPGTGEENAPTR